MNIHEMRQESHAYRNADQSLISCLWWIASEICLRLDSISEQLKANSSPSNSGETKK